MSESQHQTETPHDANQSATRGADKNWQVKPSSENAPSGSAQRTVISVHNQGSEILGKFEALRADIGAKNIEGTIIIAGKAWHCTISDTALTPGIKFEMQSGDTKVMVSALENGRLDFSNIAIIFRYFFESVLDPQNFKPIVSPVAEASDKKDNTNGTENESA